MHYRQVSLCKSESHKFMYRLTTHHHCIDTPLSSRDLNTICDALYYARSKWKAIGETLGVHPETSTSISRNNKDVDDCLKEMIRFHLRFAFGSNKVTWKQILESLRVPVVACDDVGSRLERRLNV